MISSKASDTCNQYRTEGGDGRWHKTAQKLASRKWVKNAALFCAFGPLRPAVFTFHITLLSRPPITMRSAAARSHSLSMSNFCWQPFREKKNVHAWTSRMTRPTCSLLICQLARWRYLTKQENVTVTYLFM